MLRESSTSLFSLRAELAGGGPVRRLRLRAPSLLPTRPKDKQSTTVPLYPPPSAKNNHLDSRQHAWRHIG